MAANLPLVRASRIPFGFIFTLTQYNVDELDWAAGFAVEQGADLFQIHPLEETGRASELLAGSSPDGTESAFAYVLAEAIRRKYGARLHVQVDIFHREAVRQRPGRFYADDDWAQNCPLADLVSPIVVEADGVVAPLGYGFGRRFVLGSLTDQRLGDMAPVWIRSRYVDLRRLCREVYAEACRPLDSALPQLASPRGRPLERGPRERRGGLTSVDHFPPSRGPP